MSRPAGKLIAAVTLTILLTLMFCAFTGTNPFDANAWLPMPNSTNIEQLNSVSEQELQQQLQQAQNVIGSV